MAFPFKVFLNDASQVLVLLNSLDRFVVYCYRSFSEQGFSEVMYHFFRFANVEIEVVSFAPLEGVVD